jgi:hypothetical protein
MENFPRKIFLKCSYRTWKIPGNAIVKRNEGEG